MRKPIKAGTTDYRLPLSVADSSSLTGEGLAGLVYNTAGLVAEYRRDGQSSYTPITLVSATLGTYVSGGFVDEGSLDGDYELGIPNAAIAAGVDRVWIKLYGAANMVPVRIELPLTGWDDQDAVRGGMSALPNAASNAVGGLGVLDANGNLSANTRRVADTTQTAGDLAALISTVDGVADAIKLKTDLLPASPASTGDVTTAQAAIVADTEDIQSRLPAALVGGRMDANAGAISGDATAADNLEAAFDGTGGVDLTLRSVVVNNGLGHGVSITGAFQGLRIIGGNGGGSSPAIYAQGGGSGGSGLEVRAGGTAAGMLVAGGDGINGGPGATIMAGGGNKHGLDLQGAGSGLDLAADNLTAIGTNVSSILADTGTDGVVVAAGSVTSIQSGLATSSALATVATNITTILNRIGVFAGSGVNTILGFLQAVMRKDATLPSDVGGTYAVGTDSLEGQVDTGGAGGATPEQLWTYASRTLTQSAAQVEAIVAGSTITVKRGDKWTISLTGIGSLSNRTKLWVTVKKGLGQSDDDAVLQWVEGTGLTRLNGAATTAGNGAVSVTDAPTGALTITLEAAASVSVEPSTGYHYDIQALFASGPVTRTQGMLVVTADVTRATS